MIKVSSFKRIEKDFYPTTDPNAIPEAFIQEIRGKTFAEPCCGEGDLTELLMDIAKCKWESDVEYRGCGRQMDALDLSEEHVEGCDFILTNPPYRRQILLPLLEHFVTLKPTWLLLPADLMHNKYFGPYMDQCEKVISVGRIKWFADTKYASTDNFAWYLFQRYATETIFIGR